MHAFLDGLNRYCNHADPLKGFFFILELKSYCTEYMHAFLDGLNENTVFSKCTRRFGKIRICQVQIK
jgi:hypothetical protein